MSSKLPADTRIAEARERLASNLGALQQRLSRARELTSPGTYLRSPWLKVGLGLVAGYLVGRGPSRKRLPVAVAVPASHGLMHAAARAAVTSLAGTLIQRAVAQLLAPPASPQVTAADPKPPDRDD